MLFVFLLKYPILFSLLEGPFHSLLRLTLGCDIAPLCCLAFLLLPQISSHSQLQRASSASVQSNQSGAEGHSSENDGTDSDNDRISEEEDHQLRAQVASARRRSSEFDRDSLADFVSGPSHEEDTGRAAAMAMRLMANLRNEHDERKRLQAIVEQAARPPTGPSSVLIAGARPPANLLMGVRTPTASNTDSPVAQRAVKVGFAPTVNTPADSPLGSRASTLASGGLRPLSQEFGLAVDPTRGGTATLPAQRAARAAAMTYKAKQQPDAYDPQHASADPVDLRNTLKDAKSKLRPVSRVEDTASTATADQLQCTFTADCKCAGCR
jgi:hypothetical protein